jgi:aminoglycoside phosphotransferase (APT) family kinase protein
MPAAEVEVTVDLVRQLLAEQHPDVADLPLGLLANGWDNMLCTVGEQHGLSPSGPDVDAARTIWKSPVEADAWAGPPTWVHGDLHPANVLVDAGKVSAVIDFGDITSGDPATDLSLAWMMFTARERYVFRQAYAKADDDTWARARGWALSLSLVFLTFSADNPLMAGIGQRTFREVLS